MDFMFSQVHIGRIEAKHAAQNIASGKVLRKAGMRYRGHVREYEYYASKAEWHDADFYAITREEYMGTQ
jgi:ribosomal-protein-alanine N-acetyltransferase